MSGKSEKEREIKETSVNDSKNDSKTGFEENLKEKSIRDVLNRLKWDPRFDFEEVEVVYIDRVSGSGYSSVWGWEIEDVGHKFLFVLGDTMIPIHRIVEVKYRGKAIWSKLR